MKWYLEALRKYAQFDGRARRMEYWFFSLFTTLIYILLLLPFFLVMLIGKDSVSSSPLPFLAFIPAVLFIMAMIVPSLAVTVRRLHDTGRSGWFYFISFVPVVGGIIVLVFLLIDGQPGPNLYGPSPKYGGGYGQPYPPNPPYPPAPGNPGY